ncbi:MAG: NFACT family protein [Defluviitaleaceae bacterium]|nr:NFACT family protein [Defluviitaleaceae bacterium]
MAFDGICIAAVVDELSSKLADGRIDKIAQTEKDEITLSIRAGGANYKLMLTTNASYPRLHLVSKTKESPLTAPMFCMILRKHIGGGRVIKIAQQGLERIVKIHIQSYNEMGDLEEKTLILEIMGRHSNIILVSGDGVVLDAIKHISYSQSSVRQVLPGRPYADPPKQGKKDPLNLDNINNIATEKDIFENFVGVSKASAGIIMQIAQREGITPQEAFKSVMKDVGEGRFSPYTLQKTSLSFAFFGKGVFGDDMVQSFDSPSGLLEHFYNTKDNADRIKQKSQDMRRVLQNLIERCVKKADIHAKTQKEIANMDSLRLFGELITANIHALQTGMAKATLQNFYDGMKDIDVVLNPQKTPAENAQEYFKKYNKQKRTAEALVGQVAQNKEELAYLEGVLQSIAQSETTADLNQIREELQQEGFIKKTKSKAKEKKPTTSKPMHFITDDGFDVFVGKNNMQNDTLTKNADKDDIWLHAKNMPGSHVILKTKGREVPTQTLEEAVNLAAFYSKGQGGSMVPVDYCLRKNIKKQSGGKPGAVIYDNYKTAYITPNEERVGKLQKGE